MTTVANKILNGDVNDPSSVAVQCLIYAKGILAVMHPKKKGLSLLGFNPLDGLLHGLREQCDAGMTLMHLDSAANKLVPMIVEGVPGKPPGTINFTQQLE